MKNFLFKEAKDYLYFEYENRKNRRPSYSLRAFARDLNWSPSGLNDFLKGRVGVSKHKVEEVAERLNWSELSKEHFKDLVTKQHSKDAGEKRSAKMRINIRLKDKSSYHDIEKFKLISRWYYMVINQICHIKDNITEKEIERLLGISKPISKQALKNLVKLKILEKTPKGLKPTQDSFQFGEDIPSDAIKNFHSEILNQAQEAINTKDIDERTSNSFVFTIDIQDREALNKELQKALFRITNKYSTRKNLNGIQVVSLQSFNPLQTKDPLT